LSKFDDDDITKIEDLPNLSEEELESDEDFESLEDLAKKIDIHDITQNEIVTPSELESLDSDEDLSLETEDDTSALDSLRTDFNSDFNNDFDQDLQSELQGDFEDDSDPLDFDTTENHLESPPDFNSDFNSDFNTDFHSNLDSDESSDDSSDFSFDNTNDSKNDEDAQQEEDLFSEPIQAQVPTDDFQLEEESAELDRPITKTEIITNEPSSEMIRLDDIEQFGNQSTIFSVNSEGNPPFSIILKNPKFVEDVHTIIEILIEASVFDQSESKHLIDKLTSGQLLIPRLGEYHAIKLCHKLRMFNIDIIMGLTEEIHPAKSYESKDNGLLNKDSLLNNKKHYADFQKMDTNNFKTTTLSQLDNHKITKYLGIITKSKEVDTENIVDNEYAEQTHEKYSVELELYRLKRENYLASQSNNISYKEFKQNAKDNSNSFKLELVYKQLMDLMILEAKNNQANAIVGVNFNIIPINLQRSPNQAIIYQVQCTGNMVWIERI